MQTADFAAEDRILVTGAGSGIGRAVALSLIDMGASVIGVGRTEEKLVATRTQVADPNRFVAVTKDLEEQIDALDEWVRSLAAAHGRLRGMVLCAGRQQVAPLSTLDLPSARKLFDVNYFCNLILIKGFADRRVHTAQSSAIVIVSSVSSISGEPGIANYSASKGALNSVVRTVAVELARQGVRANAVLPGLVRTPLLGSFPELYSPEFLQRENARYPLGLGAPEQVAEVCCFLVSRRSSWITGQTIVVDGGSTL